MCDKLDHKKSHWIRLLISYYCVALWLGDPNSNPPWQWNLTEWTWWVIVSHPSRVTIVGDKTIQPEIEEERRDINWTNKLIRGGKEARHLSGRHQHESSVSTSFSSYWLVNMAYSSQGLYPNHWNNSWKVNGCTGRDRAALSSKIGYCIDK